MHVVPLALPRGQNVALGKQWAGLLKQNATFSGRRPPSTIGLTFTSAAPTDDDLARLRSRYQLDSIAGQGPEVLRIINVTGWVYQLTGHDDEPEIPKELTAFNLIRQATDEHMQINCYMKTIILNKVYLAMFWRRPSGRKGRTARCGSVLALSIEGDQDSGLALSSIQVRMIAQGCRHP